MEKETIYKIESSDSREIQLMLDSNRLALSLYEILSWLRSIRNGKNYGEGVVLYRGKLYNANEWMNVKHEKEDYKDNGFTLKDPVVYLYTEDEIIRKLDELTESIQDRIYDYFNE